MTDEKKILSKIKVKSKIKLQTWRYESQSISSVDTPFTPNNVEFDHHIWHRRIWMIINRTLISQFPSRKLCFIKQRSVVLTAVDYLDTFRWINSKSFLLNFLLLKVHEQVLARDAQTKLNNDLFLTEFRKRV